MFKLRCDAQTDLVKPVLQRLDALSDLLNGAHRRLVIQFVAVLGEVEGDFLDLAIGAHPADLYVSLRGDLVLVIALTPLDSVELFHVLGDLEKE